MMRLFILWLMVVLSGVSAHAWWPTEHAVVAAIAEPQLSGAASQLVTELLMVPVMRPGTPALAAATDQLLTAPLWLDLLSEQPDNDLFDSIWTSMHYFNASDGAGGCDARRAHAAIAGARQRKRAVHLLGALDSALVTLRDREASQSQQAVALRVVLHLVGDLHQPLHVISPRVGGADTAGGHALSIPEVTVSQVSVGQADATTAVTNVHAVWDAAAGLIPQWPPFAWHNGLPSIGKGWQAHVWQAVPVVLQRARDNGGVDVGTPERWAEESWIVGCQWLQSGAMTWTRQHGRTAAGFPQYAETMATLQTISAQQLVRAGQRLAALLNSLVDPYANPTLTKYLADLEQSNTKPLP